MRRVVLLTDFGTADGYVAAMAGTVAALAPSAAVEHASHDIAPGDVLAAALALSRYARLYPPGTVHLVVVDPGVGTERRALAATIDGRHFVAPDNGVLTLILHDARSVELVALDTAGAASATFHGRDVFAPAAGRLAAGTDLDAVGTAADSPFMLDMPEPVRVAEGVRGEVLQVDWFGNLITNIPADALEGAGEVWLGFTGVGAIRRTYGDVPSGEPLALVGSLGLLEVSIRDGSAADRLKADRGAPVFVDIPG